MLGVAVAVAVLMVVDLAVIGFELVHAEADVCKIAHMVICSILGIAASDRLGSAAF